MSTRTSTALILVGMTMVSSLFGEGLLKFPNEWRPFVERISTNDFLVVENRLSRSMSDTSELVVYDTLYYPTPRAFSLTRKIGQGYELDVLRPTGLRQEALHKKIRLPKDLADKLLSVVELSLTKQVYAPTENAPDDLDDAFVWIYLRIDSTRVVSGRIRRSYGRCSVGDGLESTRPFLELLSCLESLCTNEHTYYPIGYEELNASPLMKLDLAIDNLRRSYPDKK